VVSVLIPIRLNRVETYPMKFPVDIFPFVLLLLWLCAGCSTRAGSPPPTAAKRAEGVYHVVRSGENLFRIGKAYDVPFEELARVNGIKNAGQIHIGQRIFIPGTTRQLPVAIITPVEAPRAVPNTSDTEVIADSSLLSPVSGTINSRFGPRGASFHDGIDIAAPEGTPIRAIESGEVVYSDQLRGYGNIVIVRHAAGLVSVYAHNQANLVREGQQVARGEVIAKVGSTGRVTGPHLHFEIRRNNTAQDPLFYLPQLCCFPPSDMVTPEG
jgi:murein DD-endopeptidase MepM/ murein hydrolase activator NlpD